MNRRTAGAGRVTVSLQSRHDPLVVAHGLILRRAS
jgi:hypothetical protein